LAYQLFGYELDESNKQKWPPNMLALFVARVLSDEPASPFFRHVKLALAEPKETVPQSADLAEDDAWAISIATVVEGIIRLISSHQADDRNRLLTGTATSRQDLPPDEAPLRGYYIEGRDRDIYSVVADFFRAVSEALWAAADRSSFITRTVGVQATFDILRIALERHSLEGSSVYESSKQLLQRLPPVDFSDNFFHASGAGRVRIRNVLGILLGLIEFGEIRGEQMQSSVREFLHGLPATGADA
jgi:hypothetical protein